MPNPLVRPVKEILTESEWAGRRCFIIGGGPSLSHFDFKRLDGELVIGCNKAYKLPQTTIAVVSDARFWAWHHADQLLRTHPRRVWACSDEGWVWDFSIWRLETKAHHWGTNLKEGVVPGADCGSRALNLADILGASPIYLLGFDMLGGIDGKQQWWHEGYPRRQNNTVYRGFIAAYENLVKDKVIQNEVINLNPHSALHSFPKQHVDEVLK